MWSASHSLIRLPLDIAAHLALMAYFRAEDLEEGDGTQADEAWSSASLRASLGTCDDRSTLHSPVSLATVAHRIKFEADE